MSERQARIRRAFEGAARYDDHADVQRVVAGWLAAWIGPVAPEARVLEIGCGTGFLAEAVRPPESADWLMTDLSPAMLARSRARFAGRAGVRFALLDAEHPDLQQEEAPFDLVCGSLAVQWFANLEAGLRRLFRLLAPGGRLVVTTLAAGTFGEWRRAHAAAAVAPGTPDFASLDQLAALRLDGAAPVIEQRVERRRFANAAAFLAHLKGIGAGTPRSGHRPLAPAALKAVSRAFEEEGAIASYEVALLCFARPAGVRTA